MRAVTVVGVFLASLLVPPIASADASCEGGAFAVGGYPKTGQVPDGYQPVDTPGGIFPWEGRGGYNHGQAVGAANVIATVDAYAEQCRHSSIHLFGHSYGAAIIHTAVETIDTRPYAGRVHVHVTGNPRHPGGIEDTYAGWTPIHGLTFRGAGRTPTNVASWRDDCNPHDGICRLPRLVADPVGYAQGVIGYFSGSHRY